MVPTLKFDPKTNIICSDLFGNIGGKDYRLFTQQGLYLQCTKNYVTGQLARLRALLKIP